MTRYHDAVVQVQRRLDHIIRRHALIVTPDEYQREIDLRFQTLDVDKRHRAIWLMDFAKLNETAGNNERAARVWEKSQFRSLHCRLQRPKRSRLPDENRDYRSPWLSWPSTALYLLSTSPTQVLDFIEITNHQPYPPLNLVARCFLYLRSFRWEEIESSPKLGEQFRRLVHNILHPHYWVVNTPGLAIRLYCQFATHEDRQEAFAIIAQHGIRAGLEELLYIMSLFTKESKIDDALNVLQFISHNFRSQLSSEIVQQHCCDLLQLDEPQTRRDGDLAFYIWPSILGMHVQPDLSMFNIILRSAIHHGMTKTAWDILDLIDARGFDPDSYTWLSLIDHTIKRGNQEELDRLDLQIKSEIAKEPHIVSKMLHAHLKVSLPSSSSSAYEKSMIYSRMLEIYAQAHDPRCLNDLGILRVTSASSSSSNIPKSPPSSHALYCLLSAFLKAQARTDFIMQIFRRFQNHVRQGHPHIGVLGETDHPYNAFLLALQATEEPINASLEVLLAMLQPLPDTARLPTSDGSRPIQPARPTSITWTIVLTSFMPLRHRHPEAIWKIQQLMSEQELGPTEFDQTPVNEG